MTSTAQGWLDSKFGPSPLGPRPLGAISSFKVDQQALQSHFAAGLPGIGNALTQRVTKKGLYRVGKLFWAASTPVTVNAPRFGTWTKTSRRTNSELNLQMNCWEGILYLAFQCDILTAAQCTNFYQDPTLADTKLRNLFGVGALVGGGAGPQIGDLLTYEDIAAGVINHVAIYIGQSGGRDFVLHNLSYNAITTGLHGGGSFHFESMDSVEQRYGVGNVNVYYNTPFWEAGAGTHAYYTTL